MNNLAWKWYLATVAFAQMAFDALFHVEAN